MGEMAMTALADNCATLERELDWAGRLIEAAICLYFEQGCDWDDVHEIAAPQLARDPSPYASTVREHAMSFDERLVLILALAPHLRPQLLDPFLMKNDQLGRPFTEFGGASMPGHPGFWPTLETAAFILAGASLPRRLALQVMAGPDHFFRRHRLLDIGQGAEAGSLYGRALAAAPERLDFLTMGAAFRPGYSERFPAHRLHTKLDWNHLVLAPGIGPDIDEITAWIEHGDALLHDQHLARHIKPGFRSLFYGPPGTGKTLTAALLGQRTGRDVYRVDLSMVVSKYIGETEKNLGSVFDLAAHGRWILFFDEADALFGKRTQTTSANDRHANQEVAYLLQRIEDCPGVVILATNLKANIDEAFARRFQSMVYFPMPRYEERLRLWRQAFARSDLLDESVDLGPIAHEFELSGASIANVLRYATLMALRRGRRAAGTEDIREGIRRELRKDGKVV
jgi:hypothetical protein